MNHRIIWSEGMFLQPQHFQQQQQYNDYLLSTTQRLINPNSWGIDNQIIDDALLKLGKFSLTQCQGLFPDGTLFNAPHSDKNPLPLEITENHTGQTVYLATLERKNHTAEISLNNSSPHLRYHTESTSIANNIVENTQTTDIHIAKLNLQLLTETDEKSNYSCIPIARIKEVRSNQTIILDNQFIPTCINAFAALRLQAFIEETHSLLQHRAEMLAYRLTHNQQAGNTEITDFMLLQLTNRFEPLFYAIKTAKHIHPENLFYSLLQLCSEMTTFIDDRRRLKTEIHYIHRMPNPSFDGLIEKVRHALSLVLEQNATRINLAQRDYGLWVGDIADKELLVHANFVLSVFCENGAESTQRDFTKLTKIAAVEMIRDYVTRALPGIDLQRIVITPRQIPQHPSHCYFLLNKHSDLWATLSNSLGIAIHVGGNFPGLKLELWAIRG